MESTAKRPRSCAHAGGRPDKGAAAREPRDSQLSQCVLIDINTECVVQGADWARMSAKFVSMLVR